MHFCAHFHAQSRWKYFTEESNWHIIDVKIYLHLYLFIYDLMMLITNYIAIKKNHYTVEIVHDGLYFYLSKVKLSKVPSPLP